MAKRKSRSKRRKSSGGALSMLAPLSPTNWHWPTMFRTGVAFIWLGATVAVILGWIYGVPRLEARVAQDAVINADRIVDVQFAGAPSWVTGELESMLAMTARAQLSPDPFARGDLIRARAALLETGCFETIDQVRRIDDDLVEVRATFLEPYAVAEHSGRGWLIDRRGRLLPPSYRVGEQAHFIRIRGLRYGTPERPAAHWEGTDVTAALRLIRLLETNSWAGQIEAVDMSGFMTGQPIRIVTDRGTELIWDSPPGEEPAGEVTAREKIRRLQYLFDQFGHIDGGYESKLDLTDPRGVFAR